MLLNHFILILSISSFRIVLLIEMLGAKVIIYVCLEEESIKQ